MSKTYRHFETSAIHAGYDAKTMDGSLTTPIFQTSTFTFESAEQGERRFAGEEDGYIYSRLGNPTVAALEEKIAALENGERGLAFASGMAAVSAILIALTKANDHILCSSGLYGCTFGLLTMLEDKYNIRHDFSEMETKEDIRSLINDKTACIYVETPINPTMKLVDLRLVAEVAKEYGIPVVVDNTFSSPYLQRPLELGCDVVIHSATKYIGGHGDVIAGLAVGQKDFLDQVAMTTQKDIGGIIGPMDAWLLLRGLKTLPVRLERHCDNAEKIAAHLKAHPAVKHVYYPGDADHPDYALMQQQMKRGGGVIAFEMEGTKKDAQSLLNQLQFLKIAVSLGDAETLIEHPATMTHAAVPEKNRLEMGITDQLIRLSVGLEAWEDIWEDLQQALDWCSSKSHNKTMTETEKLVR
ncbi:methionine gamma-lyase [Virgibacillus halophilus]|uniref:methionine gamma-lyase n=1 Tax=Tigheibacillus halophilus TaxID=361280 RepID=UPI0036328AFF